MSLCRPILSLTACLFVAADSPAQTNTSIGGAVTGKRLEQTLDSFTGQGKKPHIYKMNYWISGGFSAAATVANIYAIPNVIKSKVDLTDAELAALTARQHNGFDEWALNQDPSQRDVHYKNSDIMMPAVVASTFALGFDKSIRRDWLRIFVMYYETHAVTFSLYNFSPFGPAFQNKVRPYSYYDEHFTADQRRGGNQRNSLYSGHTATTAAATFFAAKVYSDYHPEIGRKKHLLYGLASVPPLIEGYLRMKALAHFPSDILVGYVIGATCGVAVPALHRFRDKGLQLGLTGTPAGPGFSLTWQPVYR